ncbi:NAD(P)/FAD-dependent oxidoreductase [Thermofilum pendens]|uniref:FAD dependent oxidoreductase n=1 Tax=Thermofilum pendens (strain DSM 2475 / Hrk 5) TaxID=368408 RepID=A1RYQ6_THEPD|nr:FAD-binding oxidoreductase [Thermofilum pendens]ABL78336.1 FAD dependent oxidoreductase [Thermofilum pendens Hrk 5]
MYDVVIVGGGIVGVSLAYRLAEEGAGRVLLLEKGYLGGGSTFRCAGGIRASFTSREHIVLMKRSIELWGELREKLGVKYERSGYLWLISRERDVERFKEYSRVHNSFGVETRFVDEDFVKRVAPYVDTSSMVAALYDPLAGKASPFDAVYKQFLAARSLGVEFAVGREVDSVRVERGEARGVVVGNELIPARSVVVAAGAESVFLLRRSGVELPLAPVPHHAALTEEFGRLFDPLIIDVETGAYAVQTFHGHVLMGVEVEEEPFARPVVKLEFLEKVVSTWSKWLTWLPGANILRYWVGYYEVTPDHHPILGPVDGVENLYVATGFSGHGFMMAPVVAEELAEWIKSGKPKSEEAARLTLARFKEGRLIKELAVIG